MKRYSALTVFPEMFEPYMSLSIMGRARNKGLFEFKAYDLRDWTYDRHRTVDDAPFGGGQGMLMKPAPIFEGVQVICDEVPGDTHVVFFAPWGTPYNQTTAKRLAKADHVLFVCGRYEGIDQRAYSLADDVISLGDFVLTGGELPAMCVIDSLVRLIPDALGDEMSAVDESFSDDGLLEYVQYTRPSNFEGMEVPAILLSGDHPKVDAWRRKNAIWRTAQLRPDMIKDAVLDDDERAFANRIINNQHTDHTQG